MTTIGPLMVIGALITGPLMIVVLLPEMVLPGLGVTVSLGSSGFTGCGVGLVSVGFGVGLVSVGSGVGLVSVGSGVGLVSVGSGLGLVSVGSGLGLVSVGFGVGLVSVGSGVGLVSVGSGVGLVSVGSGVGSVVGSFSFNGMNPKSTVSLYPAVSASSALRASRCDPGSVFGLIPDHESGAMS